jgi:hypothetical protein
MFQVCDVPLCLICKHYDRFHLNGKTDVCWAFQNGIPEPILRLQRAHTTTYPGDNGIMFERDTNDFPDEDIYPLEQ